MEPLSSFDAALSAAIGVQQRRKLVVGVALLSVGLVGVTVTFLVGVARFGGLGVVAAIAGLVLLVASRHEGALGALRGGTPEHWLPSKSHGVLLLKGDVLVSGTFNAPLDKHGLFRVASVSYDEAAHGILVQVLRTVNTQDGEREVLTRELVLLDAAVTPERGFAFARMLLELTQR